MVRTDLRSRLRDAAQEERERRRYELLERIYLLRGTDCRHAVSTQEMKEQLGCGRAVDVELAHELVRLGLLHRQGVGPCYCITRRGVEFMQRNAWRRRSVRDA